MTTPSMTYEEGQVMVDGDTPFMPREKAWFRRDRLNCLKMMRKGVRLTHHLDRFGSIANYRVVSVDRKTGVVTIRFDQSMGA